MGSSPLTRGKRSICAIAIARCGLIPAHAGKTSRRSRLDPRRPAHPRSRGENFTPSGAVNRIVGSSPLTRGKLESSALRQGARGLIPAHAGKTKPPLTPAPTTQAHPRSRGENNGCIAVDTPRVGSSPLTRGKHDLLSGGTRGRRLIPAHAGKTLLASCTRCGSRAHPRSRGENRRDRPAPSR